MACALTPVPCAVSQLRPPVKSSVMDIGVYAVATAPGQVYLMRYLGARKLLGGFVAGFTIPSAHTWETAPEVGMVKLGRARWSNNGFAYRPTCSNPSPTGLAAILCSGEVTFHPVFTYQDKYHRRVAVRATKRQVAAHIICHAIKRHVKRRWDAARLISSRAKAAAASPYTLLGQRIQLRRSGWEELADSLAAPMPVRPPCCSV